MDPDWRRNQIALPEQIEKRLSDFGHSAPMELNRIIELDGAFGRWSQVEIQYIQRVIDSTGELFHSFRKSAIYFFY